MKKNIFSYEKLPSLESKGGFKSEFQTLGNFVLDGDFTSKEIVSVQLISDGYTC